MAKVTGPLMSLSASGSVASTITFSSWKGRSYVRELVIPSNPRTSNQQDTRNNLGGLAKAATAVLTWSEDLANVGSPFFTAARDQAPSGQSWISFFQKSLAPIVRTISTSFAVLDGTVKGYFNNTASDVGLISYDPSWLTISDKDIEWSAGVQLYALAYFASNYLDGAVKIAADLAIAGASQEDVDAFGALVHETTP